MSSLADLFPPGTDLCQIPSGSPPEGEHVDFSDQGPRDVTISLGVILTTIALVFALGRLYANLRKLGVSDVFVLLAILCNIAKVVTMIIFVKYFRHMWDTPLCWINGQFELISYVWEMLNNFSLFFSKTATLLLFRQLFTVSRPMRIAIWVGIAIAFVIAAASLGTLSYYAAPHAGKTWDELIAEVIGTTIFPLYWSIAQGSAGIMLDMYIFILPLPVIYQLNLSKKRKLQVAAIFFTGFLAVVASTVSLVYRVKSIQGPSPDSTYYTGILVNCNLVEMNIAVIVCSTTAFVSFMRAYVLDSRVFKTLRSSLGSSGDTNQPDPAKAGENPNRPRTGRNDPPKRKPRGLRNMTGYIEMSDTWLLNSGATVNIEGPNNNLTTNVADNEDKGGLRVINTVDVERGPAPPPS